MYGDMLPPSLCRRGTSDLPTTAQRQRMPLGCAQMDAPQDLPMLIRPYRAKHASRAPPHVSPHPRHHQRT